MSKPVVSVTNVTQSSVVCRHVRIADTFATRLFGLLGEDCLEPGSGLLLEPATGTQTWGMTYSIDIVTLDSDKCVVGLWENVRPWRMRGLDARTRSVLVLAAGQIARTQLSVGDELEFTHRPTARQRCAPNPFGAFFQPILQPSFLSRFTLQSAGLTTGSVQ